MFVRAAIARSQSITSLEHVLTCDDEYVKLPMNFMNKQNLMSERQTSERRCGTLAQSELINLGGP